MISNLRNSLSKKILFMVAASFLLINIFIHGGITLLNKQTFYELEGEKADIIVKNYAPMLAMSIYLGMDKKIYELLDQILQNDSVLQVEVYHNNKLIAKKAKYKDPEGIKISTPVYKPNSKTSFGKLQIIYSTKQFEALMHHYAILIALAMVSVIIALIWLNLYIQKLLNPLKKLATMLKHYSPESNMQIPYLDQKDEIGLISNALNCSHQKTREYEQSLQKLNETLEDKVQEKTEALQKQLSTEAITRLPNRVALNKALQKRQKNAILAILSLDNFKQINSFYGYDVGDKVLNAAKEKILTIFNESDYTLYKLPGREFVLFSEKSETKVIFSAILAELANILNNTPLFVDDYEVHVTFTIGASINENPLLGKADIALQEAYKLKQPVVIYNSSHEIERQIDKNIQMIKKIKQAIYDDRITVYFQPIFDNKTGKVKSYESLVRLIEPDGKVLSPYFFLDIAAKAKLYKQIAKIVILKSCQKFSGTEEHFSLNMEIDDILDKELVEYILKVAKKYDVLKQLTFEILESESIEDIDAVAAFTNLVSSHGCKVSIDDFGSGYSNFMHVLKLDADYLKIDGSLIKNIHTDKDAKIIVRSIVKFAKELGLKTVAEFVHCQEVQNEVIKLGIDYSQGYLLGEPKPKLIEEKEEETV